MSCLPTTERGTVLTEEMLWDAWRRLRESVPIRASVPSSDGQQQLSDEERQAWAARSESVERRGFAVACTGCATRDRACESCIAAGLAWAELHVPGGFFGPGEYGAFADVS